MPYKKNLERVNTLNTVTVRSHWNFPSSWQPHKSHYYFGDGPHHLRDVKTPRSLFSTVGASL